MTKTELLSPTQLAIALLALSYFKGQYAAGTITFSPGSDIPSLDEINQTMEKFRAILTAYRFTDDQLPTVKKVQ